MRHLLPAAVVLLASSGAAAEERRFALVVTSSGEGEARLPHARADGVRVREALLQAAGFPPGDTLLVSEPTSDDVLFALGELEARARAAKALGTPTLLFVWCTATAEAGALRLGSQRLPVATLAALLQSSPADRRVGAFDLAGVDRAADAQAAPAVTLETRGVPGLALLTVTARGPRAHEAPLSGGGHLAFHVANALRGAADGDRDGIVTLVEALRWVGQRAGSRVDVAAIEEHPLARLGAPGLALADDVEGGRAVVVDAEGRVAGELELSQSRRLVLPPGDYVLKERGAATQRLAAVTVRPGEVTTVARAAFREAGADEEPVRAGGSGLMAGAHWSVGASAGAQLSTTAAVPSWPALGLELTLHQLVAGLAVSADGTWGWATGVAAARLMEPLPYSATHLSGGLAARWEWRRDARVVPFVGVRLGLNVLTREFEGDAFAPQRFTTLVPGAFAGVELRPWRGLSLGARVRLHGLFLDETPAAALLDVGAVLSWRFGGRR